MNSPVVPLAVVGPTATGKTALAVDLARELGGEVVNADAMQLYRGMDIGTAKATEAERRGVAHHLLDVLDVTETASVAAYQRHARAEIERLLAAGKVPVLAGGSGLYVQAVLDDLRFPGTDPAVRARLDAEAEELGTPALYTRLGERDPVAAAKILPTNTRRIVRALEVIEITGEPFSANLPAPGPARYGTVVLGVDRLPEELDERVNERVVRMFEAGLVDEVRELEKRGLREGKTASRALGYQQVLAALDGDGDFEAAAAATAQATRRFVRKQRSWFRRDQRIHWFDGADPGLAARVLDTLGR
ncbi:MULTISPECIES: tRNA (adenosine(37)-N6)-dimethylallyltransferase MiaA [unclassified Amycolatopsis]|uniref:tRNA (adenosine(37)-N6)-dimethylallyltransferase MiaA n=1 Tax=unclassified Amycolatopsis TaxID=2618356 RepID=UPI002874B207|nr:MULTISPECIES: tRNA (adenosine(37)-N6)-dimethylallyltransferase MiaA [unclassified Amycolatopsis]MDS0139711.1 tRNA (adenosine(37)-N6)-dimethylallyltransferase MiaA [Amycolatopsis sp. 505]MDS0145134.1 tRNA (adenosine(37)-N6)-dimethylallyltransferase MiaA [Amycolatopsis sp. CM201R]